MKMNQAQFMRNFNDAHREQFNPQLFERNNADLVHSIEQVVRSCEKKDGNYFALELLSFEVIENYEEIYNTLRAHEEKRKRKSSKLENSYDFINIRDTDMILCKLEWFIRHNGVERQEINGSSIEVVNPEEIIEVLIALPRFRKNYYFRLSGNYYATTFQIVDGSTYNNSTASQSKVDTVTMKTMFMPVRVFRGFREMVDVNTKEVYNCIEYVSIIFNNSVNALYYIFAQYGLYGASKFLDIDCVYVDNKPNNAEDFICVNKHDIYISCPRVCFQDPMVQTYVATLYTAINKDTTVNDLFDIRFWLKNLGTSYKNASIDKGLYVLDSIDGIYDIITQEDLHLPDSEKESIYNILRWILREFSNLRTKDNVDVSTKRIRIADYIAAMYAKKLNSSLHRIRDLGPRVTLKKIIQAIYTQPLFIINNISSMSNLVAYREMVNDNDATVALKYTYKGISGLGEDGASVQKVYRYVDASHIGIIDLDSSSSSDPGMSGMICPMANLYDGSFSEYEEPNTWRENYQPIKEQYKEGTICPVEFSREQPNPFEELRNDIGLEILGTQKIICPIYNFKDPSIHYTLAAEQLEKQEKPKSIFTIRKDDE